MTADWNQRFVLQTLPGSPGQPLTAVQNDTMIWSKTHKHLRKFFEEWRQSLRDQQNAQFNAQIQKSPLPPTADLNLDLQATIPTFFQPKGQAAALSPLQAKRSRAPSTSSPASIAASQPTSPLAKRQQVNASSLLSDLSLEPPPHPVTSAAAAGSSSLFNFVAGSVQAALGFGSSAPVASSLPSSYKAKAAVTKNQTEEGEIVRLLLCSNCAANDQVVQAKNEHPKGKGKRAECPAKGKAVNGPDWLKERAVEMGWGKRDIGTGDYIKWLVKENKAKVIRPSGPGQGGQVGEYKISALAWGQLGI